jgi:hypothetical protein
MCKIAQWGIFFVVKIAHHMRRAAHGYEPTREHAMAAFAKSWRIRLADMVIARQKAQQRATSRRSM